MPVRRLQYWVNWDERTYSNCGRSTGWSPRLKTRKGAEHQPSLVTICFLIEDTMWVAILFSCCRLFPAMLAMSSLKLWTETSSFFGYLSQQQDKCLIRGWNMLQVEESLHVQSHAVSGVTTHTILSVNALVCLPKKPMGGYGIPNSWSLAPNWYPSSSASPPLFHFSLLSRC